MDNKDLDTLARAYLDAPITASHGTVADGHIHWGYGIVPDSWMPIKEIKQRYHELSGKPTEWVHTWTRFIVQDGNSGIWYESLKKPVPDGCGSWSAFGPYNEVGQGEVIGDYRNTLEERDMDDRAVSLTCGFVDPKHNKEILDELDGMKQQPQWEEGELPPVGTVCECYSEWYSKWVSCRIIAIHEDEFWAHIGNNSRTNVYKLSDYKFRPIKTERERVVEKMEDILNINHDDKYGDFNPTSAAQSIYDQIIGPMMKDKGE